MKYIFIMCCLLFTSFLFSQDILVNKVTSDISSISEQKIRKKFLSSIDESFGLYYVDLSLEEVAETKMAGIDNKTVLLSELTIRLYSLLDESLIAVNTLKLTASGNNISKARKNVVKSIRKSKRKINKFLKENTANTITDCNKISAAVEAYLNTSQFAKAYSIAGTNVSGCADQMWVLKQKAYDRYQEAYCDQHLLKVESLLSIKEYPKAIKELVRISPDSKCKNKINDLIKTIKENYQTNYDKNFKAYLKYLELNANDRKDRKDLINLLLIKNIIND